MKSQYFEIYCGEDGVSIKKIDDIYKYLQEASEEGKEFLDDFSETPWDKTRKEFTRDSEQYSRILIRGEIVTPIKKEVVVKYDIER